MRFQRTWLLSLLALFLGGLLAGCGGLGQQPAQTPTVPAATAPPAAAATEPPAEGYPGPAAQAATAYPAPGGQAPTEAPPPGRQPEPVPMPSGGMAVVHGVLHNVANDQPIYDGVTVYLSKVVGTDTADMDMVSLDRGNDPSIVPDVEGGFAFGDVPPGRYGIVVQGPLNQYLTRYSEDTSKDVIFTVEAGQTLDLGKIFSGYP